MNPKVKLGLKVVGFAGGYLILAVGVSVATYKLIEVSLNWLEKRKLEREIIKKINEIIKNDTYEIDWEGVRF